MSAWDIKIAGWRPVYWFALNYVRYAPFRTLKEYLRHGVVGHTPRFTQFTNKDGITFDLDISECVQKTIFCFHYYEPEDVAMFKNFLKPDAIVFDVGANVGQYSLLADSLLTDAGKVYAFEPSPDVLKRLERNLQLNNVKHLELIAKAVADKNGTAKFYPANETYNQGVGSLLPAEAYRAEMRADESINVEIITLDSFCEARGIHHIDVLKVDVEGFDLDVLKGAKQMLSQSMGIVILAEVEPVNLEQRGLTTEDFLVYMRQLGFHVYYVHASGQLAELFEGQQQPNPNLFFLRPKHHVGLLEHIT